MREVDGYSVCVCTNQWKGRQCDEDVDECDDDDSKHDCVFGRQVCRNMMGGFECDCVQGWMDDDCRTAVDSCRNETCLNGGWCEDTKCKCHHGVSGYNCQIDNKCASNACKNGATCRSTPTGYRCQCTDGFAGRLCSDDVDECDRFDLSDVCPDQPVCVNTMGSFSCCRQGRTGADCDTDIDECDNPQSCHSHGRCINTDDGYRCECDDGFEEEQFCAPSCALFSTHPTGAPPAVTSASPTKTSVGVLNPDRSGAPAATNDGRLSTTGSSGMAPTGSSGMTPTGSSGIAPTGSSAMAPTAGDGAASSATAATPSTDLPRSTPSLEARAGDGDDDGGGGISSLLDYSYYAVAALAVLIAALAFAVYRSRSAITGGDDYYEDDSADGKSKYTDDSDYSLEGDESEGLTSLDMETSGGDVTNRDDTDVYDQ